MKIQHFFDQDTATFSYVIIDEETNKCAIIDSVLNYDIFSAKFSTKSADDIINYIQVNNLKLEWILETHIHADHISAANYIKNKIGGKIAMGEKVNDVIKFWLEVFNDYDNYKSVELYFDHLFYDNEKFKIGNLEVKVMHSPGHTPACVCYIVENDIFVGDTIFNSYLGTSRTDFPGGDARTLYCSIQKIFNLGDDFNIYVGHDYPKDGENPKFLSNVKEQKISNILINQNVSEDDFVKIRNDRDRGKKVPNLILPSLQLNIRAGRLPEQEKNGVSYLKIPLKNS